LNEGTAERPSINKLSELVIGSAIEVHRHLGPGLLESAYEACLSRELELRGLPLTRQVYLNLEYKGINVERAYRFDLLVDQRIVVEVKAVEEVTLIHKMQLLTYLRLTGCKLGLVINFNTPMLWKGVRRVVLTSEPSATPL
ncbi:MAG TPA: GxxExxY protein, partial [Gemmatimonadales bacterium]|nr:GxxExxY protein [Gemmatimonadales bacterium]